MRSPVPTLPLRPDDARTVLRRRFEEIRPGRPTPRRALAAIGLGALTLGLATILAAALEGDAIGLEDASPVYLLAVVAVGSSFGTWAAVTTAVVAFLIYDLLFTEPRFSLVVSDPREWVDLLLFLFVALAIGRLVALQRGRAEEADQRAREATSLFAISRTLATSSTIEDAAPDVARRLASDLGLPRVWIVVGPSGHERVLADTGLGAVLPSMAVVNTLMRAPGDEPARWVRTHEPGRGQGPGAIDGQILRVRMETTSDGSWGSSGSTASSGYLGAVRAREDGMPDRAATRILALAADQLTLALRRDRLRAAATDAEVARQGDALKTALIDSVSHDLRTPLASIRATAGGLADPDVPWSEAGTRDAGRLIDDEAARLDRLVRGVLDLSRIEAGAVRAELAPHDLRSLVEPAVARYRTPTRAVGVSIADDLPPVLVDDVLIDVILGNLLDNASTHAGPDAPLRVSAVSDAPDRVELVVEDGGPGVPPDVLPRLFERFYRVPRSGEGARHGLGIGLSVVRGLTEAMGGTADARRSDLGGLAVVIRLRTAAPSHDERS
jgi:two-component system sensor histidine kinase KdpD